MEYVSDDESDDDSNNNISLTEIANNVPRTTRSGNTFVATTVDYVSDCIPQYISLAASAATDLRTGHITPKHYGAAIKSPDKENWQSAIHDELKALRQMNAYVKCRSVMSAANSYLIKCYGDKIVLSHM